MSVGTGYITFSCCVFIFRKMTDVLGFAQFLVMSVSSHFFHVNTFLGYQITIFFRLVHSLGLEQLYAGL